jgi:hypothetical protein
MPLPNNPETQWIGYVVDDAGGQSSAFFVAVAAELSKRDMPKVESETKKLSMWWRSDSQCFDVRSKIDGEVLATIHAMDYGTSLFVGIAFAAVKSLGNYYKRMAAVAFLETVDRCAIAAMASVSHGPASSVHALEGSGKFGT